MSFFTKWRRPLLAAALVCGLGTGMASAYDSCYPCARTVVVKRTVRPVRVRRVCRKPVCAPVVYRTYYEPAVVHSEPRVIYSEPAVVYSAPAPCTSCP